MLDSGELVMRFVGSADLDRYKEDVMLRSAVERQLQNLGEALVQLTRVDPDLAQRIPEQRRLIAFRNVLVHAYATLDHAQVWRAIGESLPPLLAAVRSLLAELDPPLPT
jgi:uncharacterized protein with HEPN domain